MFKKLYIFTLFFTLSTVFAMQPIEKLLIKKAVEPEQKQAVKAYLLKVAKDHEAMAKKYTELSKQKTGKKFKNDKKRRKEMLELAEKYKLETEKYKEAANKL